MRIALTVIALICLKPSFGQTDTTIKADWKVYQPAESKKRDTVNNPVSTDAIKQVFHKSDSVLAAQNKTGEVTIHKDARIDSVATYLALENDPEPATLEGYRVQILITQNKAEANKAIKNFEKEHEDIPVYRVWVKPNHPVRAGDCRSKLEAEKLLNTLKFEFPGAYIVRDIIQLPPIEGYKVEIENK